MEKLFSLKNVFCITIGNFFIKKGQVSGMKPDLLLVFLLYVSYLCAILVVYALMAAFPLTHIDFYDGKFPQAQAAL